MCLASAGVLLMTFIRNSGRHSHPDPEVGYIMRGEVAIQVNDGATPTLASGVPLLILPGVIHNARNVGSVTTNDAYHIRGVRGATPRERLRLKVRVRDSDRVAPFSGMQSEDI